MAHDTCHEGTIIEYKYSAIIKTENEVKTTGTQDRVSHNRYSIGVTCTSHGGRAVAVGVMKVVPGL
jgi:hypothetical protein